MGILLLAVAALFAGEQHATALSLQVPPILHDTTTTTPVSGTIRAVVARTDMGSIIVAPGSAHSIRFHKTWNYAEPTMTRTLRDGVLTVTAKCAEDHTSLNKCSDDLLITVPSVVTVDADTGFGNIVTKNLKGNEKLGSSFGDITASRVAAGAISASSSEGRVAFDLASIPTTAFAKSSFGDILMKVPAGTYAVSTKTGYGDVHVSGIRQDSGASRKLTAISSFGDITVGT